LIAKNEEALGVSYYLSWRERGGKKEKGLRSRVGGAAFLTGKEGEGDRRPCLSLS